MKTIIALALFAPLAALAHPGHGETLHAHPELWIVIVAISAAVAFFHNPTKGRA